jgi:fido (protein-threonine AMPylation protein)
LATYGEVIEVLRNRFGITSVRELERKESEMLLVTTQQIIDETRVDQRFGVGDVRRMHQRWLGEIYGPQLHQNPKRGRVSAPR